MKIRITKLALAIVGLAATGSVQATTTHASLNVSVNVSQSCTLWTTPVTFLFGGDYQTAVNATGEVSVACPSNVPYVIALDGGLYEGLDGTQSRFVSDGSGNGMNYALYSDFGLTTPWGDTGYGDTFPGDPVSGTGTGSGEGRNIYAVLYPYISVGSVGSPGTFSDTVNVTVNY